MNIFLTLDYELFFGDVTGTPENCLIRPMNALCNSLDKYGIKFIIFVDAAYLLRMFQLKGKYSQIKKDFDLVTNHIKFLKAQGHDIQLHFHPQWLYSDWNEEENNWVLDFDHYKLSDMDKAFAIKTFAEAKKLLDGLIGEKTYTFRAGGYSLETFTGYIELFNLNKIIIDSSVSRGAKMKSKYQEYDFRKIPKRTIYRFDKTIREESETGRFLELSISSCRWNPVYYFSVVRSKLMEYDPKIIYGDGKSIISKIKDTRMNKLKKLFRIKIFQACIDGAMSNVINVVYKYAVNKRQKNLVFIGHPKNFSDQSIRNLEYFVKEKFNKVSFVTTKTLL